MKLTERNQECFKLWMYGETIQEIGKRFHISYQRVLQIVHRNPEYDFGRKERERKKQLAKQKKANELIEKKKRRSLLFNYKQYVDKYWDFEKNKDLDPSQISTNSHKKIWLLCPIDKYSWETYPACVTKSWSNNCSGCRICASKNSSEIMKKITNK